MLAAIVFCPCVFIRPVNVESANRVASVASVAAPEGKGKEATEIGTADARNCASVKGPDTGTAVARNCESVRGPLTGMAL